MLSAPTLATQSNDNAAELVVVAEGQVTDGVGAGQEDVSVTLLRKVAGAEPELIGKAVTDRSGDFAVMAATHVYGELIIRFDKPLHASIQHEFHHKEGEHAPFFDEQMAGNLAVIGVVEDALTRLPIAGAKVNLKAQFTDKFDTTDEKGRFTIKGVSPGKGQLIVDAKNYGRERQRIEQLEEFGEITISLKPERLLHVRITDDLGAPIRSATVELADSQREDFRTFVTNEDGRFDVPRVHFDANLIDVRLSHPDFVSSVDFDQSIEPPGDATESSHELKMIRAGRIAGRVVDASDKPVYGARVSTGSEQTDKSPREWADYQGSYTISGVSPGTSIVTVFRDGYSPELQKTAVRAGETTTLDFQLGAAGTLRGVVRSEDGKPVPSAEVYISRWREYATLGLRAATEKDGSFVIENAPADEFEVTVVAHRAVKASVTVKAEEGKVAEITLPVSSADLGDTMGFLVKKGDPAPDFTLSTVDGASLSLADYKGKYLLLDFWATWCGPCVAEVPHLIAVQEKFGARKDFAMIGISLDHSADDLRNFIKKRKLTWAQAIGPNSQLAAGRFGVSGIPAIFLIDSEGKIIEIDLRGEQIIKRIEQVFAPTP